MVKKKIKKIKKKKRIKKLKVKKVKTKAKVKTKTIAKTKLKTKAKRDNKRQIASILVWVAIILLVFQGVYSIVVRDQLVSQIDEQSMQELVDMEITMDMIKITILYIAILWIVFAALMFLAKIGIEKKKVGWGWLLALSIITLFTGRIESAILGVIASVLYAKSK